MHDRLRRMMEPVPHPVAPPAPEGIAWSDDLLLGFGDIDEVHQEFVSVLNALLRSSDRDFMARLDALIAHAEAHFGEEDRWMIESAFPPAACHIEEHAAVLKSAYEARAFAGTGDIAFGRAFAAELAYWFRGHVAYLDSALAAWMFKRQHGGRPVVLRRGAAHARGEA